MTRGCGALSVAAVVAVFLWASSVSPASAKKASRADSTVVRPVNVLQLLAAAHAPGSRAVLLNVWATWCAPCREEFPDLLQIEREYRKQGVRLVLVSGDFDTELPAVKQFLALHKVGFPTFIKHQSDLPFIQGLDKRWSGALPVTLLYDGGGRTLWFHEGKTTHDTLKSRIEAALAAAPDTVR